MIKKVLAEKNSSYSVIIIATIIVFVVGIWLYAAHCFEKNIIQAHNWLLKTGHITTSSININKYFLTASAEKPMIKIKVDDVDVEYSIGDRIKLNYHLLTKTLTLQPVGDETVVTDTKNNKQPLVILSKKDNKNDSKYSLRFSKFIPIFKFNSTDPATMISSTIKAIKSIRIHSKNSEIQIYGMGTVSAELFKFTTKPYIKREKEGEVTLHLRDRYVLNEFNYVIDKDTPQPLNTVPLPKTTSGRSHMIIHLGDKSVAMTDKIINEFMASFNWKKLCEALEIQTKSEGKQTFEGLTRNSLSNMAYSGSKKTANLHVHFDDLYSAAWKKEYLPLLQLASSFVSSEKQKEISDESLLTLLPVIENHNPIKKTIDIDVTFNDTLINTKFGFGYTIAPHAAHLTLELPLKKNEIWGMIKQLDTFTDRDLDTYIDGSITAKLILKNSKEILDDMEAIFIRCQKMLNDPHLFGDLKANRQFADTLLTSFGEKIDNSQLKIQVSYDTKLKKLNYDSARNAGDIMTTLLPMLFGKGHDHGSHGHAH